MFFAQIWESLEIHFPPSPRIYHLGMKALPSLYLGDILILGLFGIRKWKDWKNSARKLQSQIKEHAVF